MCASGCLLTVESLDIYFAFISSTICFSSSVQLLSSRKENHVAPTVQYVEWNLFLYHMS